MDDCFANNDVCCVAHNIFIQISDTPFFLPTSASSSKYRGVSDYDVTVKVVVNSVSESKQAHA